MTISAARSAQLLLAAGILTAISACTPEEDKCDSSTIQTVQLSSTLIDDGVHNAFYLTTPAARSACDAHYTLTYHWAAAPRNTTDAAQPTLSNIADAFHVDNDTIWWYHDPAVRTSDAPLINWQVDFSDHNA